MFVKELAIDLRQDGYMADHWIERRLEGLGKTKADLARALHIKPPRLSEIFNGARQIQPKEIVPLAVFLEISNDDVLRLESSGAASEKQLGHLDVMPDLPPINDTMDGIARITEWDAAGGAGSGIENQDKPAELVIHYFAEITIRHELNARPENCHIIRVVGDSMEPKLLNGDRVMFDVSKTLPSPPGIFVVNDGMGLVVKRLEHVHGSDPATVRLISDNPLHEPYELLLEEARIVGRVIWFSRRL